MENQSPIQIAEQILKPTAELLMYSNETTLNAMVPPQKLKATVKALINSRWGYLSAITGIDSPAHADQAGDQVEGKIEILYHFCHLTASANLRVSVPYSHPVVPTICDLIPSASLHERELMEMFGVQVEGTPNTDFLLLPDGWPRDVYPLRKSFVGLTAEQKKMPREKMENQQPQDKFIIPIGPQHPALKEPGHFEFTVEGETITGATARLGYVHRGMEKLAESRTWVQVLYLMERVCGICSHAHSMAFALGVESLAGVTVPPRAQAIRSLVAELERIHSHLLWFGVAAHEAGFETLFMYSWRDRETVMDIIEGFTGNRVNYSVNVLGGIKSDLNQGHIDAIRKGIDYLEQRTRYYLEVVRSDETFLGRTRNIGTMTKDQAELLGAIGPTARASGVPRDIRVNSPYAGYVDFPVNIVLETNGDLEARFEVRIKELFESYRLIREILDKLPTGDLAVSVPRRIPAGEAISRVEAPRGELIYFVKSSGGDKPERVKARAPSLCNWASVLSLAVGHKLADMPMLLSGMDPCFSCNDRLVKISSPSADPRIMRWEDLRQYGIDYYKDR